MYDNPDNDYGSFDEVWDKGKMKFRLKRTDLTKEERKVWDDLYELLISKFYHEHNDEMEELELLDKAFDILKNKQKED